MRKQQFQPAAIAALCAAGLLSSAHATNGMNMEGYGPIATGMGGAATAYDNGTAAMANNPATLQLAPEGHRFDGAVGMLGPDISASMRTNNASSATSFVMPAVGWTKTNDRMTFGFGIFSQGGMGAEYGANSDFAMGTGDSVRSELGVGRVIFPVAYRVNDKLTVGGSLDYIWAGLDMKMAANGAQFAGMLAATGRYDQGTINNMVAGFGLDQDPQSMNAARIDFSDNSDFSGSAKGTGFGGKIGATYQATPSLRIGASYHGKTALSNLSTSASSAVLTTGSNDMSAFGGAPGNTPMPGKMTVLNFQWPATTSIGMSWEVSPKLTIVGDFKSIAWSDVMSKFNMQWQSAQGGDPTYFSMTQNWKDQNVTMLGAAYKLSEATTLRAGINTASNPVPDETAHFLFPAIVKSHYTFGMGHRISDASSVDISVTVAPKVTVAAGYGGTITHSQTNFQLMYSYRY